MNDNKVFYKYLLLYKPEKYWGQVFTNYEDIKDGLSYIRDVPPSLFILKKVIELYEAYERDETRFESHIKQKYFRTLKVIKNNLISHNITITNELIDKIFYIFEENILYKSYSNYVNPILIDITLSDNQIHWLISNVEKSEHIFNRVLRYPIRNDQIAEWAIKIYKSKNIHRKSEVISLFIKYPIQDELISEDKSTLYWACYYSKIDSKNKKNLLNDLFAKKYTDEWLKVVSKLAYFDLIEEKII